MINFFFIVGMFAAVMSAIQFLPQVWKSFATKQVNDISIATLLLAISGSGAWLAYGLHLQDLPIILANSINFLAIISLILLKIFINSKKYGYSG